MKYSLIALAAFCTLTLFSCDKDLLITPQKYKLDVIEIEGVANDPIIDGEQITVVFQSANEETDYELELDIANGKFSTAGSYVMATDYTNMPMAATERVTYNPSKNGNFREVTEGYAFEDAFLSIDFGSVDLTVVRAGTPTLVTGEDLSLTQEQTFTVDFSDDGWIEYTIITHWIKI